MRATLSFTLPDEREEFDTAVNAARYVLALEEFAEKVRQKDKYSENPETTWHEVRELFWETLKEVGVEI